MPDDVIEDVERYLAERLGKVARATATTAFERIVERTPEKSGEARDGWKIENAEANLLAGEAITISNDVEHIEALENGSSKRAPAGMAELTVGEMPDIIEAELRKLGE